MEQSIQTAAFIYGFISLVTLIVFFVMADNVSQIKKSLNHNSARHININSKYIDLTPYIGRNSAPFKDMSNDDTNKLLLYLVIPLVLLIVLSLFSSGVEISEKFESAHGETTQETPTSIQHFNPSGKFH